MLEGVSQPGWIEKMALEQAKTYWGGVWVA